MRPKTKASTRKPRLGLTSREKVHATGSVEPQLFERPQTAPASLNKVGLWRTAILGLIKSEYTNRSHVNHFIHFRMGAGLRESSDPE